MALVAAPHTPAAATSLAAERHEPYRPPMSLPASAFARALTLAAFGGPFALGGCRETPAAPPAETRTATAPAAPASKGGPMNEPTSTTTTNAASLHSLRVKRLDGTEEPLAAYAGKVLLVVNTASECGFTPQYEPLQAVHAKYKDRGFSVLGFPSNDFGEQEPGTASEIASFCSSKYGVTFPMFEKVKTKGDGQSPVYKLLSETKGAPKWNFHKYLVDKTGKVVAAWPSAVRPDSAEITRAVEEQLAK